MSRILYIQYTNPAGYPPLQHSSRMLADAGWNVRFLGAGADGSGKLEFPRHAGITVEKMHRCPPGWRQKLHFLRFCLWVIKTVAVWRPQWIYASDPLSCPAAVLLTWFPGLKVLYHEHDAPGRQAGLFGALIARSRRALARRADLCILPNAKRLERFSAELGPLRASACVWNCPSESEVTSERLLEPGASLWLLYHGSIVPDRLPLSVLDALALLPDYLKLRVVGYETAGSKGYVARLRSRAEELGLPHRIEFLGPMHRADLLRDTGRSDIGLALVPPASPDWNFEAMTGASNKVFDYLACGLPLVVSDLPDWRETLVAPGYARACNPADPESLAAAIRWFIDNPRQMRAMGEAGRRRIRDEWNYENIFRPVLQSLGSEA